MTALTVWDRIFRLNAQLMERPALAMIPSQRVLRTMFEITAKVGQRVPPGTALREDADGHLWVTPPGVAADAPLLLYLHGGGFTIGSPRTHQGLIAHVAAAAGLRACAPRYPLAPEHPFPAAPEACLAFYRRLCAEGAAPVAVAGDSAGANLALGLVLAARDGGLPLPRKLGLIGPLVDMTSSIEDRIGAAEAERLIPAAWARRLNAAYLAGQDPTDPRASPGLQDLSGLPPTLIQVAKGEALAADAALLMQRMPDAEQTTWDGLQHVWQLRAGTGAAATRACAELGAFLRPGGAP